MANSALTPVEFRGASLSTSIIDGVPFVAMRQICDAIGICSNAQHQRIKRHPVLSICSRLINVQMPGDDQAREVLMLPLDKLNGWLFGVSVSRCKPELRELLTQYQAECFDVLARHFGATPQLPTPAADKPKFSLLQKRWLVYFDCNGVECAKPVPSDAMVLVLDDLPRLIRQHEDPVLPSTLVAEITHACADRQSTELAEYKKHSQWLSKKLAATGQKAVTV